MRATTFMKKAVLPLVLVIIILTQTSFVQQKGLERIKLNWGTFTKTRKNNRPYIAYTTHNTLYKYRAVQKGETVSLTFEVRVSIDTPKTIVNIQRLNTLSATDKQALLNHEQGHTDLAVAYGRRLYHKLSTTNYTTQNFKTRSREIYLQIMKELANENVKYDVETEHGFDKEKQKKWDRYFKTLF